MRIDFKAVLAAMMLFLSIGCYCQAKKPTVMLMPSEAWCLTNGYVIKYNSGGQDVTVPDYEAAIKSDIDLNAVVVKISSLMEDRRFPVKDLRMAIMNVSNDERRNEMLVSKSGSAISETPYEKLLQSAKADIVVGVGWRVNKTGPKKSVTYMLQGVDSYTGKTVASQEGTGAQSFSAEVAVLLEEAVVDKIDGFLAQLTDHFADMAENGREGVLNVRVFDNSSGIDLETELDGNELSEVIDDWMNENTVKHRYGLQDQTGNMMRFEQVRMPLYDERGRAVDMYKFANGLRKYLQREPYNIVSKVVTLGLGRADIIIGEK